MVIYVAIGPALAGAIESSLPDGAALQVPSWSALRHEGIAADAIIIAVPSLVDSTVRGELIAARTSLTTHPIVLVTTFERENASLLGEIEVDEVVWLDEVREKLRGAVERALLLRPRRRLASAIGSCRLSPVLRRTIGQALMKWPPPRTVIELGAVGHCSVSRLEELWRAEINSNGDFSPKRFLDLLLALRAAELIRQRKPVVVAFRLGIDLRTLERLLRRAGDWTPRSLSTAAQAEIAKRLSSKLLPANPGVDSDELSARIALS